MLEYAANVQAYWNGNKIRELYEQNCEKERKDVVGQLQEFLETDETTTATELERFWAAVYDNIRNSRIRMIFASDQIPPELTRIIEYLSSEMRRAAIFGVEIQRFVKDGYTILRPRVIGVPSEFNETRSAKSLKKPDIVPRLVQSGTIPTGAQVMFVAPASSEKVAAWLREHGDCGVATWKPHDIKPLTWAHDNTDYSVSGLALKICFEAGDAKQSLRGTDYWQYNGKTLRELGESLETVLNQVPIEI